MAAARFLVSVAAARFWYPKFSNYANSFDTLAEGLMILASRVVWFDVHLGGALYGLVFAQGLYNKANMRTFSGTGIISRPLFFEN